MPHKCSKGFWIFRVKGVFSPYVYFPATSFIKALLHITSPSLCLKWVDDEVLEQLYFERSFKNGNQ